MSEIADMVAMMNKSIDRSAGIEVSTDAPGTDAPSTELPGTELPGTDAPSTDEPVEDFETDPPSTEAPSTESPPEPDEKDKAIEELRAEIERLKAPKTSAPSTEAPMQVGEHDFLKDEDFDELTSSPEEFNKLLNKIYKQAVEDTQKALSEKFNSSIPEMVKTNLSTMTNLQKTRDQFYENNPDLKPFQKAVATVFEELAEKNPNKTYEEVLKDVASESRKRLGLDKKKPEKGDGDRKPPRLPKKKSKPGKPAEPGNENPLQSELEEMNKTLGR